MTWALINSICDRLPPKRLAGAYQTMPRWWVEALSNWRFRQAVRWTAKHSSFYREAFAKRGIDPRLVRRPSDLGDFFTTPEDIVRDPEAFICKAPTIVFESSGTSGKNKQIYYDHRELTQMGQVMAAGLYLMGMEPKDRVANAFDFSMWIPGMISHYALMAGGNFCMAFGKVDPSEVYRRLRQYRFNVVMGEPTWLIRLTEIAERDGGMPLKMLIGGAEEMPHEAVGWMQKIWQGAKVRMCYGSVEQGSAMGYQPCGTADIYHVDDTDFLPEVVDTDENGFGELVYTTLSRRVMPLIRYRSRDVTRLITERCPCGHPGLRMSRLLGRRDEMIVASGGNLYPLMFENILDGVDGISHDWQVVFRLEGIREVMEIHVESGNADSAEIERQIHARAADLYPDLMKNLALGIFQMRVIPRENGSLRTQRKMKRMVDLRYNGNGVAAQHTNGTSVRHIDHEAVHDRQH